MAVVNVSCVQTLTRVTTQIGNIDSSLFGCHFTGDTWDVTVKSRPAGLTLTGVGGSPLPASSPILTGRGVTPTNQVLTVEAGVSMWAGALVGAIAVLAGAAIQTGFGVTLVDVMLAVAPSEARRT